MSTTEVEMASAPTPVETTDEKGASKTVDVDVFESPTDNYAGSDAGSAQAIIEVSEDDTDVATTATKRKILFHLQFYSVFFVKKKKKQK